mgnify:CR=1 FL=1
MRQVNIAIVGLGQIGNYLYNELIIKKKDIEIKTGKKIQIVAISAKNKNKKRKFKINKKIFYKNPLDIIKHKKVDVLIEAMGFADGLSKKIVENALRNKIHVITPNKALISKHGDYLSFLAEKNKVNLEFEAAVAGGIPIVRTIKEGLATNKITKVYGILNGTCNYILSQMEKTKDSFKHVLKWRLLQEKKLRITGKGRKTMTDKQIKNFIMYYERLTKHMLKTLSKTASTVISIDDKHRLKSIKFN